MKHHPVIHPFLFAIYPVLAILAASLSFLDPIQAIRPLIVYILVTTIIFLFFRWIFKDWHRAGFISSMVIFMLFYYGYSYRLPREIHFLNITISRHLLILCFWIVFLITLASKWLWIRVRPQIITNFLNISSGIALLYAIYLLAAFWFTASKDPLSNWSRPPNLSEDTIKLNQTYRPDIYYVILDGYAGSDVLQKIYNYDNTDFINALKSRGFYIAESSHSNYGETQLSLASSLNFEYLDYLSFAGGLSTSRYPLGNLIINSRIRSWLENAGYRIYLSGEYLFAEIYDPALVFFSTEKKRLRTFESLLLESTILEIMFEEGDVNISTYTYQTHREKILDGFAEVQNLIRKPRPKFVFVHIIAPHPPFVFDKNGDPIQPDWEYTIFDAMKFAGGKEEYIEGYRGQVMYINQLVIDMVNQILLNSSTPPIIILQADHGPAVLMGSSLENSCLKERFSILNAIYLPDDKLDILYSSITPVNTFRVIFNTYFGTQLEPLPDKNYYSFGDRYRFIDVTNQVDIPCDLSEQP